MDDLSASLVVTANVKSRLDAADDVLSPVTIVDNYTNGHVFTFGDGATGEADQVYYAVRTLAKSTAETLDLTTGLTNRHGEAINFETVHGILVESITGDSLIIGGAASNQAVFVNAAPPLGEGDSLLWTSESGYTIDASHKSLKFDNTDAVNAAEYLLVIIGINA